MKTRLSKIIWLVFLIALPAAVQGQFIYATTNGAITITGYPGPIPSDLIIPSEINGLPVTAIGDKAFDSRGLTSVTIPSSITNIENTAFLNCENLNAITVAPSNPAYSSADGIWFDKTQTTLIQYPPAKAGSSFTVPNSVTSIGDYGFYDCGHLTNVTIPNSVTSLGILAFNLCSSFASLTIPDSVTSIGDWAFSWCTGLAGVTIPGSVTNLGSAPFEGCSGISAITVDTLNPAYSSLDGVLFDKKQATLIEWPAGKTGNYYTIPDGVTSLGNHAFSYFGLAGVTIPNSVTNIRDAFYWSSLLRGVYFKGNAPGVDPMGFFFSYQATAYYVPGTTGWGSTYAGLHTAPWLEAEFNFATNNGAITITGYTGPGGDVTIPSALNGLAVTAIGDSAFYGDSSLTSVTIPNSVTNIGNQAFYECTSLINVSLPNNITRIGGGAFQGCHSLTSISVPSSVTSIGASAFYDCPVLIGVYFMGNAPGVDPPSAFSNDSRATVYYLLGTTGWSSTFDGRPTAPSVQFTYATNNGAITITGYAGTLPGDLTIPSAINGLPVTAIGNAAFFVASSLASVTIPNSVTSIGEQAFYWCANLTSISIPSSVNSIGRGAFYGSGLTSVTIPSGATNIEKTAFYYCENLNAITVDPLNPAYSSADGVWFNKTQTTLIQYPQGKAGSGFTVPNSVTNIGDSAFAWSHLTSVTIPNSVTSIGFAPFDFCTNMTAITVDTLNPAFSSLDGVLFDKKQTTLIEWPAGRTGNYTIPNSVTNIGNFGFYACWALASVTIPSSVTSIGDYAFDQCIALTAAYFEGNAPSVQPLAFSMSQVTVYYLPGTIGWGSTFAGRPTALWVPPTLQGQFNYATNNGAITIIGYTGTFFGDLTIPHELNGVPVSGIGDSAFYGCSYLASVTIPESVTNIGNAPFEACTKMSAITVDTLNPAYSSLDGVLFDKKQATLIEWPAGKTGSYTIPDGVTSIGAHAFSYSGLTVVTIPESVTNIEDAFFWCTNLVYVYFKGNAPGVDPMWGFNGDSQATVYYFFDTSGWGPTFGGRPTAIMPHPFWIYPLAQTAEAGSAVKFRVLPPTADWWFFNGSNNVATGGNVLHLANVQASQAGVYTAVFVLGSNLATSPPAILNVIPRVERRMVPILALKGQPGSSLNLDFTGAVGPALQWTTFDHVLLTQASQWYFDFPTPLPPQGFYRAWQSNTQDPPSTLDLRIVPALTLTGTVGSSLRVDYINQFGPTDAWVNLATVTLTNASQLYYDTSATGQPPRLWRIVPGP